MGKYVGREVWLRGMEIKKLVWDKLVEIFYVAKWNVKVGI